LCNVFIVPSRIGHFDRPLSLKGVRAKGKVTAIILWKEAGEIQRYDQDHDYRVNLKAEFEIRSLHEKIDHMLVHQWQRLMEIQQVQTDLLSELRSRKSGS